MNQLQVTFDADDPQELGAFWCEVLGYIDQPPPPGFDTCEEALDSMGIDRSDPKAAHAIVDPDGVGPRLFLLKVPEAKSAKNRMHLDVHTGPDRIEQRADELVAVGATVLRSHDDAAGRWITLQDPEGNEFCLH